MKISNYLISNIAFKHFSLNREGSIKGHFVTMVRVRDLEELDLVIARYREGIMVGGQPASVEVVVGQTFLIWWYIYGLVQDCSDSGALAMVILQSCTDSVIVASYELVHYRLIIIESSRFLFRWIHWSGRHRRVTNMQIMMMSSNGNISRVTGPLCGEFTSHQWIPLTKLVTRSFGVFFDLHLNKRLGKQSWSWWFEPP